MIPSTAAPAASRRAATSSLPDIAAQCSGVPPPCAPPRPPRCAVSHSMRTTQQRAAREGTWTWRRRPSRANVIRHTLMRRGHAVVHTHSESSIKCTDTYVCMYTACMHACMPPFCWRIPDPVSGGMQLSESAWRARIVRARVRLCTRCTCRSVCWRPHPWVAHVANQMSMQPHNCCNLSPMRIWGAGALLRRLHECVCACCKTDSVCASMCMINKSDFMLGGRRAHGEVERRTHITVAGEGARYYHDAAAVCEPLLQATAVQHKCHSA